ncbi:hypothetical protein AB0N09_27335 [Streptomyces erythrochromogenes]|uniref:hypothetical protein n=1 Tax=Streptomyces erythrochromogenes TaxID=285574 RepID=UPI003436A930
MSSVAGASDTVFGEGTPEEELFRERLRGVLSGTDSSSRVVRATMGAGGRAAGAQTRGNLLMGVALHAAARHFRQYEASDLEARLLEMMRTGMSYTAVKVTGAFFEALRDGGEPMPMVPRVITSRATEVPYTFADLKRDASAMMEDYLDRANVAVVDRENLAFGDEADSAAFIAGMRESGTGSGAFLRPRGSRLTLAAPERADGGDLVESADDAVAAGPLSQPPPFRARLQAQSFYVSRECGDQGGGRDEIYWTASAGSDKASGGTWHSQKFGAATEGRTLTFGSDNVIADLQVGYWLGVSLHCWEADQSDSAWYDALHSHLRWLSDTIFSDPGFQIGSNLPGGEAAGWIADLTQLTAFLMDRFRNHDDLSAARGIILDRYDLAIMAQGGTVSWHFNGDGHHVLNLRYTGDEVPFHPGTLEYVVHDGRRWSAPIPVPWQSATPPALVDYFMVLHAVFVRPGDNALMWSKLQNQVWTEPRRIGDLTAGSAPAMVQHGAKLRVAFIGTDNVPVTVTYDGARWEAPTRLVGHRADRVAPAIEFRMPTVHLAYTGDGGTNICHSELTGGTWSEASRSPITSGTTDPVSLNFIGTTLVRAHRDRTNHFHFYARSGGYWQKRSDLGGFQVKAGPALVNHADGLWAVVRGDDNRLHAAQYDGSSWNTPRAVPHTRPIRESAAATSMGKLYVMYHR